MPRFNLNATEAQEFEAIPEGPYPAKIIAVSDPHPSKDGDTELVDVKYEVTEGEHQGRKFTRYCPINGPGAGIFLEAYNKATGSDYKPGDNYDIDTDDMIGQEVQIIIGNEKYQGELRSRVVRTLRP